MKTNRNTVSKTAEALFHKRLARAGRLAAGRQHPADPRQYRRAMRLLGLAHLHLAATRPGLTQDMRAYRRAADAR